MSEKLKIKLKEVVTCIVLIIFIFFIYKSYTVSVSLYDVINNGSIQSVFIHLIFNDCEYGEGINHQNIDLYKEDINEFINILNKYKYSKIPKFYNDNEYPVHYGDIIDCTINYDNNKILHQEIKLFSNNEVSFYNKEGKYRDYVVKGNKEKLFEELMSWINERY